MLQAGKLEQGEKDPDIFLIFLAGIGGFGFLGFFFVLGKEIFGIKQANR